MNSVCFNGKIVRADHPIFTAENRGYRYGDGLFETMKVLNGKILLESYHMDRLYSGLRLLKYELPSEFTPEEITEKILLLCHKNDCKALARVRLSVSRGNGGLYNGDEKLQWVVETWPLEQAANRLNDNGFIIDVYPHARKGCDEFANLKSANFLSYVMAARFAKENKMNDSLLLNQFRRIADASIANVFIIKNDLIITPSLSEGGVSGVMRKYLMENLKNSNYQVQEGTVTVEDLEEASEVFLTNAIKGIRWVGQFRNRTYKNHTSSEIYHRYIETLF